MHKPISRRQFAQGAFGSAAALALVSAVEPLDAFAAASATEVVLFDPRFPAARSYAARWADAGALRAFEGDVSDLVLSLWDPGRRLPTRLRGVTTESIPFCLRELTTRTGRPVLEQQRLDRDLFAWTLVLTT